VSLRSGTGLLLLALAAAGCGTPLRQPREPAGRHFSVLTYNVNYGGYRADLNLAAIMSAKADVVCLQETSPAWEAYLRPRLKNYPHVLFRNAPAAGGMAVFSKFPVKELAWHKPRAGWFHGWALEAKTPLGPVEILSVHLRPPLGDRGGVSLGAFGRTKKIRLAEVTELEARLDPKKPRIVLGDFNEQEAGRAVKYLVAKGYTDALSLFDRRSHTWRWNARLIRLRRRFDHVLYSPELDPCRAEVIKAGASDHLPVRAVLERTQSEK